MKPTGNNLWVLEIQTTMAGRFHLIDKTQWDYKLGMPRIWRVLGVGPGRVTRKGVRIPIEIGAGDRVLTTHDHAGPTELGDGTAILPLDQVIAFLPNLAKDSA